MFDFGFVAQLPLTWPTDESIQRPLPVRERCDAPSLC